MQETGTPPPADDNGARAPQDGEAAARRLREELARLRLKLEHTTDRDIKSVLQMRIDQIVQTLPATAAPVEAAFTSARNELLAEALAEEEPEEPSDAPAALAAEQLQEVDRLIRQARVEKMRNKPAEATNLLQQAANLAPSSAPVLEALGDNLIERRQLVPAIKAYKKALRLAPKNVGLEEKLANAVLRADATGSVEEQLRRGMNDSPFLTQADIVARTPYAVLLSIICPGAGHLALGKTTAGLTLLVTWILCWIWLLIKHQDVENLAYMVAGRRGHTDTSVFITLLVMVICWIGAMGSLKARSVNSSARRRRIDHPIPPANLPFE